MLSWLVDKSADTVKSKQMIVVNTIPHQWVQIYPCPRFLTVYDICNIDRGPPPLPMKSINSLTECTLKENPTFRKPNKSQSSDYKKSFDKCASGSSWPSCALLRWDSSPSFPADISTWQRCWISLFFIWPGPHRSISGTRNSLTGMLVCKCIHYLNSMQ